MNLSDLNSAALHHQALADAYNRGIQAAHETRKETIRECIQAILFEELTPGTCGHPAKRLSTQTKARNLIVKQLAESVAKRLHKRKRIPEDDQQIPF